MKQSRSKKPKDERKGKPAESLGFVGTLFMLLMPVSQLGSWSLLAYVKLENKSPFTHLILPLGTFYWLWAVKNVAVGPLKSDLGVVTFLIACIPGAIEYFNLLPSYVEVLHLVGGFASVLLSIQYGDVAKKLSKSKYEIIAGKLNKTTGWAAVFYYFLWSNALLWAGCVVMCAPPAPEYVTEFFAFGNGLVDNSTSNGLVGNSTSNGQ